MLDLGTLIAYMKLDIGNFDSQSKAAAGKVDSLGSKIASFGKTAALGAAAGVTALSAGIGVAVKAFSEAETAQKQLEHATLKVAGGTREQLSALEDLSAELERKGVLDGDNIKVGLAQLETFGLSSDMVKKLGGSLADLAVNQFGVNASAEDLTSSANMMAKALNGDFGVLEKSGIRFTETQQRMIQYGNETQRVTALQEGFAQNLKFTNEVAVQTTEGGLAKMKVSVGNLVEAIGAKFAPAIVQLTQKITVIADYISANFEPLLKTFRENFIKFFTTLDTNTGIITLLKDQFMQVVAVIRDHLIPKLVENKDLFIAIGKFIGGVLIVTIAALAIIIKLAVVVFTALVSVVLDLDDWFKKAQKTIIDFGHSSGEAIKTLVNWIGQAFGFITTKVGEMLLKITTAYANFLTGARDAIFSAGQFINDGITNVVDFVIGKIQSIIDAVWKIPGEFANAFNNAVNNAKNAITSIPVVGGIVDKIPGFASGVENFGGGLAMVGENGRELVQLPGGSSVMPNDQLERALSGGKGGGGIHIMVTGNTVQNDQQLARMVGREVFDVLNRNQEKNFLFGTI